MSNGKVTRQAKVAGKPISSNENALRTVCKVCRRTIYTRQPAVWVTASDAGVTGLIHDDPDDCEAP